METVDYKNIKFAVWDVGGTGAISHLWRHYYVDAKVIFNSYSRPNNDRKFSHREIQCIIV